MQDDCGPLMSHLARNRAAACVAALVSRGVPPSRLRVSYTGRTGKLQTEFTALELPGLAGAGFHPAVKEFTVEPEPRGGAAAPQEVST